MQEREAKDIVIPNIRWDIFELMMRCDLLTPFLIDFSSLRALSDRC